MPETPRWDSKAGQWTRKTSWQTMLSQRYRTVRDYWYGPSRDPYEGTDTLRLGEMVSNGRELHSPNRDQIVKFYESVVRFLLFWLHKYEERAVVAEREIPRLHKELQIAMRQVERWKQSQEDTQDELESARWTALQIYRAARS